MKVKSYIQSLSKIKRIKYMIDLHGHGKKYFQPYIDLILSYSVVKVAKKMETSYSLCA